MEAREIREAAEKVRVLPFTYNNGNSVANQYIIKDYEKKLTIFQSYNTKVAVIDENGQVYCDEYAVEYSRTTSKFLYRFLQDFAGLEIYNKKEYLKAVKEGIIKTF